MLAAWDIDGKPLWKADLGVLDSGWFLDPAYQWGHSSSPIIYKDTVIVQADLSRKASFIAAHDLKTGKQVWRTDRTRRNLDVGHADAVSRGGERTDRHERHEDPRLRSGDREAAVDARPELRSDVSAPRSAAMA